MDSGPGPSRHPGMTKGMMNYADAPFAFGRRRCSSNRGMISTKLQGFVR
jgi:hypothetical protein